MKPWSDNEDGDLQECKLLGGTFATLLQILLGLIAMSVLIVKRQREVPRRPLAVWAFDASKQMIGAGFAHVANLLIAIMLYQRDHGGVGMDTTGVDQCAYYFVNFTMDTTIGVCLNWVFLELMSTLAARCRWTALSTPGDYGNPIQISIWAKQVVSWIIVIFLVKLVIAMMILGLEKPLGEFAIWLFTPLQPYPRTELAIVMIACPCLMNAFQFWVQDSFLKKDIRADCELASSASPGKPATSKNKETKKGDDDGNASDGSTATSVSVRSKAEGVEAADVV
ncbi:hypothetical protein Poli38472_011280 [Pythium oligandrum]|uniref:Vacuolar membrane protein n=1 Tax=Pythium oligandrum TaxID=41045 RepID=A0A8K1CQH4_PYTOL|nr:hypothetical protein Poli38472_011280 [Pythium oligandrum]|eukprot:TMW67660.1 hypothetical protein Poli38472_011280 [Pythium oligandrum]